MICLICRQAEIVDSFTPILLEREEFRLLINHTPAHICPGCGEAVVDEDVAIRLLSMAEENITEGIFDGIREYGG